MFVERAARTFVFPNVPVNSFMTNTIASKLKPTRDLFRAPTFQNPFFNHFDYFLVELLTGATCL